MKLLAPKLPPYGIPGWRRMSFPERMRLVCQAWASDGYGTPPLIYIAYALKIALYVGMWLLFCSFSSSLGDPSSIGSWWFEVEALQRAVLWSLVFEGLGLGCGSGPLTGRYVPPVGGALYFLRPGTTKMPLFPGLPILGGSRRGPLDVLLYVAHMGFLIRALVAPVLTVDLLLPTVVLLPLLGLADKTIFLASRSEHFFTALVCFLFPLDALAGMKTVWLGIWLWAATSKLNRHFPAVICVMTSNSPAMAIPWVRRRMYRSYPDDLRPSGLARSLAHAGTVTEYAFPLLLAWSMGGLPTVVGLCIMLGFHAYITSNIPMGVPLEWNVIMVYGAFVLFGHHAEVRVFDIHSPLLGAWLVLMLGVVPVLGNLFPRYVSFLLSMRYYAGNWAWSVWLFKEGSLEKIDRHIKKSASTIDGQLRRFYDEDTVTAMMSKVMAFRAMHLHGRALRSLVPRAVDDIDHRVWLDGELVAGVVLGWNFGEGHLHDEQLLRAIQEQCHFEPGELRCIFVESQPFFRPFLDWRIADASTGEIARGRMAVSALEEGQPWWE